MPNQGGPKEADKAGSFKGKKDAAAAGGASSAPEEDVSNQICGRS